MISFNFSFAGQWVGEEVLNLGRDLGVNDVEGQRVTQVMLLFITKKIQSTKFFLFFFSNFIFSSNLGKKYKNIINFKLFCLCQFIGKYC